MVENKSFEAGEFILFTEGEYSNYGVQGLFRAIRAFNLDEIGLGKKSDYRNRIDVPGELVKRMLIEEVPMREYWTGY